VRRLSLLLMLVPALAWGQTSPAPIDEDDDPAFSRRPPVPPPVEPDEPFPEPQPRPPAPVSAPAATTDVGEDPGIAVPLGTPPVVIRTPRTFRSDPEGIGFKVAYRTWTLPEMHRSGETEDRFHSVSIDIYPISWWIRAGLQTQVALEAEAGDWVATEAVTLGIQHPRLAWTPYLEAAIHVGAATRSFYIMETDEERDHLTLLWAYSLEAGVDGKLFGQTRVSFGAGVQETLFYTNGPLEDPLQIKSSIAFTFKLGVGY
jgi:hypothetical protein